MTAPYVDFHTHRDLSQQDAIWVRSYTVGMGDETQHTTNHPITAGIHPWYCENIDLGVTLDFLLHANISAIGEAGLDYAKPVDRKLQQEVFAAQLSIACQRNLPVIIHCVRAFEDVMQLLKRHNIRKAAFHSFTGSYQQAQHAVSAGYHLSFGPSGLTSPKTTEALRHTPLERLFIESDDSNILISELYAEYAKTLNISELELKEIIYKNYILFFE